MNLYWDCQDIVPGCSGSWNIKMPNVCNWFIRINTPDPWDYLFYRIQNVYLFTVSIHLVEMDLTNPSDSEVNVRRGEN